MGLKLCFLAERMLKMFIRVWSNQPCDQYICSTLSRSIPLNCYATQLLPFQRISNRGRTMWIKHRVLFVN